MGVLVGKLQVELRAPQGARFFQAHSPPRLVDVLLPLTDLEQTDEFTDIRQQVSMWFLLQPFPRVHPAQHADVQRHSCRRRRLQIEWRIPDVRDRKGIGHARAAHALENHVWRGTSVWNIFGRDRRCEVVCPSQPGEKHFHRATAKTGSDRKRESAVSQSLEGLLSTINSLKRTCFI